MAKLQKQSPLKRGGGGTVRKARPTTKKQYRPTDIEDLRVAQESLRNSERQLQAIIDSSPSFIFVKDIQGRYLLVNKRFEDAVGLTHENIIGRLDEQIFSHEEATSFQKNDQEVLRKKSALQFEERVLTKDGIVLWAVVEKFPLFDGTGNILATGGIATDITERKRALEQLQKAEEKARLIIDTALDAVITIDSAGRITEWSSQAETVFGWSRQEAIGQHLSDTIIPHSLRASHKAGLERFLALGEGPILNKRIETLALHRDGYEFPVELAIAPLKVEAEWTFSAFLRDITEKTKTEQALREARDELARITRLTALEQLSASIAHEINQPLSAIAANSDACLRWLKRSEPDLVRAAAAAERIAADAHRASEIVSRIRSLMKKSAAETARLDINHCIRDVLNLSSAELQKHHISVEPSLSTQLPMIEGDHIQLQQVILNLVLNGMEAMAEVCDRQKVLSITSRFDGQNTIHVSVRDSGPGVDQVLLDRIFDPFFTTKPHGTGMGLSICRSIVEGHNGQMFATAGVPHGAVFIFSLPIAQGLQHER